MPARLGCFAKMGFSSSYLKRTANVAAGASEASVDETAAKPNLEEAMSRFVEGDSSGFADLYDGAAPPIFAFLLRLSRQQALAEDLTHDTFLRVHSARRTYREGARVLPWMYTIARRLFLDTVRARRREGPSLDGFVGDPREPASALLASDSPDELLQARLLEVRVEAVLSKLPETQATAFRLLKQEGLTLADAAAVLGVTEGSIKVRAHRAYEALRKELAKDARESGIRDRPRVAVEFASDRGGGAEATEIDKGAGR